MTQPPSFEPQQGRSRPDSSDAQVIGKGGRPAARPPRRPQQPRQRENPVTPERLGAPEAPIRVSAYRDREPRMPENPPAYPPPSYPPRSQDRAPRAPHSAPAPQAAPRQALPQQPAQRPVARKKSRWRRRVGIAVALLVVMVIAWPLYLVSYGNSKLSHVDALSGNSDTPGTTYLIVGSDKRSEEQIAAGEDVGQRSDTIMLLQVPESGNTSLVSIPRDSWVTIPGYGQNKINAAYALGGPQLLVQTVEELSGITVDHYVEVAMTGVQELTDAVGGISLCLDYDVQDQLSGLNWTAGCKDGVDGTTALAFSRMRYSDPLGDIGRTQRQRQVVGSIISQAVKPSTLLNPLRQRALVGTVATTLTTDNDTSIISLGRAGLGLRRTMGEGGLMGVPPLASINYQVDGQSAVQLDPALVDAFFDKVLDGTVTAADFGAIN